MPNQTMRGRNFLQSKLNEATKMKNNAYKYILGGIAGIILWRMGISFAHVNYVFLPILCLLCVGIGVYWYVTAPGKIKELEDEISNISKTDTNK